MYQVRSDELSFFDGHMAAIPLYEAFAGALLERFPATSLQVRKTQVTFSNRHVYACASFARVKKKAELPEPYLVITLGLPFPLDCRRAAVRTEPYPGRWTNHILVSVPADLDEEFWGWVSQAYAFSENK